MPGESSPVNQMATQKQQTTRAAPGETIPLAAGPQAKVRRQRSAGKGPQAKVRRQRSRPKRQARRRTDIDKLQLPQPSDFGFIYDSWRSSQQEALETILPMGREPIFLNAPTGSGKTAIALAWAILKHRLLQRRTIIMAERRTELDQYQTVITPMISETGRYPGAPEVAFIRGRQNYHCPHPDHPRSLRLLGDTPQALGKGEQMSSPCESPSCDLPHFDNDAPCRRRNFRNAREQCPLYHACPYYSARDQARISPVVVTTYAYGAEAINNEPILGNFDHMIADEGHDLPDILTRLASLSLALASLGYDLVNLASNPIPQTNSVMTKRFRETGRSAIALTRDLEKAVTRQSTLHMLVNFAQSVNSTVQQALELLDPSETDGQGRYRPNVPNLHYQIFRRMEDRAEEISELVTLPPEQLENYIPEDRYNPQHPVYQPIRLDHMDLVERRFWQHAPHGAIAMSGTLAQDAYRFIGLSKPPHWVDIPTPFDVNRRPVMILNRTLDLSYRTGYRDMPKLHQAVDVLLDTPGLREHKGLLLWNSYQAVSDYRKHRLEINPEDEEWLICHDPHPDDLRALQEFREARPPAVLMSPTAYQAIDLPGDLCRFVIVPRPFWPIMAPRSLAALRNKIQKGYAAAAAATRMAQACGRGFRSEEDWCLVFIIDRGGGKQIMQELNKHKISPYLAPSPESMASHAHRFIKKGTITASQSKGEKPA